MRRHEAATGAPTASITRAWTSSTLPVAVDDDDAVGGDLGDLLVGLGDGALQLEALGLEAVVALGAAEADLGVDPQQHREVGPEAVGRGVGERDHLGRRRARAPPPW